MKLVSWLQPPDRLRSGWNASRSGRLRASLQFTLTLRGNTRQTPENNRSHRPLEHHTKTGCQKNDDDPTPRYDVNGCDLSAPHCKCALYCGAEDHENNRSHADQTDEAHASKDGHHDVMRAARRKVIAEIEIILSQKPGRQIIAKDQTSERRHCHAPIIP